MGNEKRKKTKKKIESFLTGFSFPHLLAGAERRKVKGF
jgi:hypothetical protein